MTTTVVPSTARETQERAAQEIHDDRARVVLCADFDETITERDTTALLFGLAGRAAASPSQHAALVQRLVARYASDVSALMDAQPPDALVAFLDGYASADLRSIDRVVKSRALKGIASAAIRDAGRLIAVREGCTGVLAAAHELHIVSSSWSAEMVRAAIEAAAELPAGGINVHANELETDADGVTTGDIAVRMQSPADKARTVRCIRRACKRPATRKDPIVVFVGDGVNDALAMLEADVGISLQLAKRECKHEVTAHSTLHGVAASYGVAIESLAHANSLEECVAAAQKSNAGVIFAAEAWADIARLLCSASR